MRQQIKTFFAGGLLALTLSGTAMAGPLEDAKDTYRKGYIAMASHLDLLVAKNVEAQAYYAKGLQVIRPLAEQGNPEAQVFLGSIYDAGNALPQDHAQAAAWYRKAADQGNAQGQTLLAGMYTVGHGVPKDCAQAMAWYRKATDQGSAFGQTSVGAEYHYGGCVPKDLAQAAAWYRKAADQGDAWGQYLIGDAYADGRGVPQDYVLAHMWLNLSREVGAYQRDQIAAKMTPDQIAEAQRMAREWVQSHPSKR